MKYVNVIDAKEQFSDLVTLLSTYQQDKIILTFAGKPLIEMVPIKEDSPHVEENKKPNPNRRRFGIAKGEFTFDDELFDSLDAEIDKMFFGEDKQ